MLLFSLSIDVAMQKLLTAVTELSKEVKDLREEFRQYVHSCKCGQTGPHLSNERTTENVRKMDVRSFQR